ncbi:MAG: hypothetical protein CME64_02145 [Halobacteriovoraceae bacterium]|nr:hypothetical protein [Halobacteriovoraceae bacterium]|tara:strand:- start:4790 stop:5233 length:444 start_codon:yes stop_codon:yes gene_type:complete
MKKYKFKLEALLKMRKLKEDQCKMEIGRLQTRKVELENEIANQNAGIDEAYESQEATANAGATGLDLRFYPYFMQGKRAAITSIKAEIAELDEQLREKFNDLKTHRANVKVLEEIKEKNKRAHKKAANKAMHQKIEEQVMNWNQFKK